MSDDKKPTLKTIKQALDEKLKQSADRLDRLIDRSRAREGKPA